MDSIKVYKWNTNVTFTVALPPSPPTTLTPFSQGVKFLHLPEETVCVVFTVRSGPKSLPSWDFYKIKVSVSVLATEAAV